MAAPMVQAFFDPLRKEIEGIVAAPKKATVIIEGDAPVIPHDDDAPIRAIPVQEQVEESDGVPKAVPIIEDTEELDAIEPDEPVQKADPVEEDE